MDNCWSTLPQDFTIEIFSRLPVKSLMRFKSLNKTWRNLISSSSDFATLHFNRKAVSHLCESMNRIRSFFNNKATDLHMPFLNMYNSFGCLNGSIVGSSSNGLVCIRLWYESAWTFVVWNPATRKFRYLPQPKDIEDHYSIMATCAGFDFRPGAFDYKLVLVKFYIGDVKLKLIIQVEVFARSTNSWKRIEDGIVPHMGVCHFDGVAINGSMYWPALEIGNHVPIQFVACFDLWEEKFTRIMAPCCADERRYSKRLGVVKGSLAMFFDGDLGGCFDGWVMNGHNQSWTKLFTIGPLPPTLPMPNVRILGFWLNGEVVIDIISIPDVFLYDRCTKQLQRNQQGYHLFQYKEALFSV